MEAAKTSASRDDAVDRLHQQLQDSLQELVTSEDWQRALAVAARFHDYSFANTRLIWAQSLARGFTPSRVAGYRKWQDLGRHVRKGERGLQILAPVIRKVELENGEEERRVVGYRVVHVFDVAQTDGEPLPEVTAQLVQGDLPSHWGKVSELISDAGFDLQVADLDRLGEANGVTDWTRRDVLVRASLPGAQRFKTAIHELAHIRLHEPNSDGRPSCRGVAEVEAESVAYMVCAGLGIDSAGYSLPYVASWSGGDLTKVAATANRVIGCARTVLTELEHELRLEREPTSLGPRVEVSDRETPRPARAPAARSDLEAVVAAAAAFYARQLRAPGGGEAAEYLRERGITAEAIDRWELGFAPDSWEALTSTLRKEGFTEDLLLAAGVSGRSRYGRLYDRMRSRTIFPIHDEHGTPVGFAGRLLAGHGPKYLNTPETELYQKRSLLYGLHLARQPIVDQEASVVVEGYTDAIAAHQAGITNVVATAGTALTEEHLAKLATVTDKVTLAFDGDEAGLRAVDRAAELDRSDLNLRLWVARLPDGRDPARLVEQGDAEAIAGIITDAAPIEHHLIERIAFGHHLDEPEAMARVIRAAASVVAGILQPQRRIDAAEFAGTLLGRDDPVTRAALLHFAPEHRGQERANGRSLV